VPDVEIIPEHLDVDELPCVLLKIIRCELVSRGELGSDVRQLLINTGLLLLLGVAVADVRNEVRQTLELFRLGEHDEKEGALDGVTVQYR